MKSTDASSTCCQASEISDTKNCAHSLSVVAMISAFCCWRSRWPTSFFSLRYSAFIVESPRRPDEFSAHKQPIYIKRLRFQSVSGLDPDPVCARVQRRNSAASPQPGPFMERPPRKGAGIHEKDVARLLLFFLFLLRFFLLFFLRNLTWHIPLPPDAII